MTAKSLAKPGDPRWSDLRTRAASALVLGPLAMFCVWYGGWAWALLIGAAMAGLSWEWARLAGMSKPMPVAGLTLLLWAGAVSGHLQLALLSIVLLMALEWRLFGRFTALGVPYVALGGLALLWLRARPAGLEDTVFLIIVVWGTDIGAYLAGRLLGGPKLAPRISPGKTWAGSVGGLLLAAVCGAVLAGVLAGSPVIAFAAGAALSVCAQAGDLLESAIKRKLGVKDSGRTIPGHGGLFDRLDGFLAAAPVAAVLALCVQGGPLWQ
jgi:phosphatidate cytidylyltransferase